MPSWALMLSRCCRGSLTGFVLGQWMDRCFVPRGSGAILQVTPMSVGTVPSLRGKQCPRESGLGSFSHLMFHLLPHLSCLSFCVHLSEIWLPIGTSLWKVTHRPPSGFGRVCSPTSLVHFPSLPTFPATVQTASVVPLTETHDLGICTQSCPFSLGFLFFFFVYLHFF